MFANALDGEPPCRPESALEQWARLEAKSPAMVTDVLVAAGVVELETPSRTQQTLRALQAAELLACVALLAGASCYLAVSAAPEREPGAGDSFAVTGTAEQVSNRYGPGRYGAFRP
jgi:hypothetical protein